MADTPINWPSNPFTALLQSEAADAWRSAMLRQSERFWEAQRKLLDDYEGLSRMLIERRREATEATLETMRKLSACQDNADWAQCCSDWLSGSIARLSADSRDIIQEGMKMMSGIAQSLSPGELESAGKEAEAREAASARGAAIAQTAAAMQEAAARAGKARFKKPDEGTGLGAGSAD